MRQKIEGTVQTHDGETVHYVLHPGNPKNPAIIMSNGVVCIETYWVPLIKHLHGRFPMITWDYRGHGKSPVPSDVTSVTMENHARDAAAILDKLGIEKCVHMGFSMGVQAAFEFYRWFPERTLGLVAVCGPFEHPYDVFFRNKALAKAFTSMLDLGITLRSVVEPAVHSIMKSPIPFPIAKVVQVDIRVRKEDMQSYFDHLSGINLELAIHALKKMQEHSARDVLPTIKVPTLIIAGKKDTMTPLFHQEEMRDLIPGSEFMLLPFGTHAAPIENPQAINYRIEVFLRDHFAYSDQAK